MTKGKSAAHSLAEERRAREKAERLLEESTTALAHAAAEIKDTKARFLDFAEIASDWLWEMDTEFRFSGLMGYFAETTGLKREDVIGKTLVEIGLFGIDEEETLRQLEFFKERKPFRDSIGKIRNREGRRHYLNVSGRPIFAPDGAFLGYRGTASDITQAIESEAALQESEERVRGILDNVADGVITINEKGKIESFNPAAEAMFGYAGAELMGQAVSTLMSGSDRRNHQKNLRGFLETGKGGIIGIGPRELVARRKDGTNFPISLAVGEMQVGGRRIFVGSIRDVTKRKKTEQALTESEQRLNAFFDNAPVGLGMWDEQLRFTKVNKPLAKFNGTSPKNHVGRTFPEILPDIGDKLEASYRALFKPGGKGPVVERVMEESTVNGKTRQLLVARFAIPGPDGRAIGAGAVISDVTDQIRAEQRLLSSEKRFRGLAEGSIQGIIVHREFRTLYANQAIADIFGYGSPDEILALDSMMPLMAPHEHDRIERYRKQRLAGKSVPRKYEFQGLRKDGTEIWLETQVAIVDWDGAPATQATVIDITEQKEAEQALLNSEARFRGLAEGSIQGIFVQQDSRILFANQALADTFGYGSPDEILALDGTMPLVAPHERDWIARYRKQRLAGKSVPTKYEFQGLRKDGTTIWLESQVSVMDWDGAPATQVAVVDITERKEAEQNLLTSERRFRDFAISAGDWLWEMDAKLRFSYLSPNVMRATGVPPGAYLGKTLKDMLGDDFEPAEWEDHVATLRARKPFRDFTYRRLGGDGAELWVRTNGVPVFDAEGNFTGYRGTASDITALKQVGEERAEMQTQLFQAQKMEALGTLAGGIAHDFNNVLTIIMGHAELLELDLEEDSAESRSAEKILAAGQRATGLVQQILAFTRQQKQSFEPVRLDRLVDETKTLLRATIPSTIEIRADLPAEPATILGDATQIHQVVMNLCVNASHAIGESSGVIDIELAVCEGEDCAPKTFEGMQSAETSLPVEIATSKNGKRHSMRIGITESGKCYRLSIRDTGTGMDRATLERAFDPFFTTKEVGKGTGIGLSAVQGIVAVHGGALGVDTMPGRGSTFTIYLPSAPTDAAVAARTGEDEPKGGSARILFVDDETALVDIAMKTLEPFGYRVTGMSDSEKALKLYTSSPGDFDLIVTDLTMPKVTGIEIARAAISARPDIPVILCTGYSENLDQPRAQAEGIHEMLYKPVFGRKLVNAVERALSAKNGKGGK